MPAVPWLARSFFELAWNFFPLYCGSEANSIAQHSFFFVGASGFGIRAWMRSATSFLSLEFSSSSWPNRFISLGSFSPYLLFRRYKTVPSRRFYGRRLPLACPATPASIRTRSSCLGSRHPFPNKAQIGHKSLLLLFELISKNLPTLLVDRFSWCSQRDLNPRPPV